MGNQNRSKNWLKISWTRHFSQFFLADLMFLKVLQYTYITYAITLTTAVHLGKMYTKKVISSTSLKAHYNLPPNEPVPHILKVSVLDSSFRVSNWLLSWPNRLLKKNRGLRKNNKFFHYKRMFQYQMCLKLRWKP